MIIVGQDKNEIVNFDNMNNIIIEDYNIKDKNFQRIKAHTETDYFVLGDYKTEERAKEILKDIISRYEAIELCKKTPSEILGYTLADYTPIYEMPKEWDYDRGRRGSNRIF